MYSCTQETSQKPPLAASIPAIDEYHEQKVEDPYRNLENLEDSTVVHWLKQQGDYATNILEKISRRDALIKKQQSFDAKKKHVFRSVSTTLGGKYFYTEAKGDDQIAKLYYRESMNGEEKFLYDPSSYSSEEQYLINYIKANRKGDKIVISVSRKGEEASEMFVMDVATQKILPGVIKNCLPSLGNINWLSDDSGFIYLHSPITDPTDKDYWTRTKSVLYTLDSDPDRLHDVFSMEGNPELQLEPADFPIITNYYPEDGYLFGVAGGAASYYDMYYTEESKIRLPNHQWKPLYKKSDKIKQFMLDQKGNILFISAKNASNFKLCRTSLSSPDFDNPEILVPESKDRLITRFEITKDGIFYTIQKDGIKTQLYHLDDNGKSTEIKPPKIGESILINSKGPAHKFLRIGVLGYLTQQTSYFYDITDNSFEIEDIFTYSQEYPDFNDIIVEHLDIPSHDDVLVPVSILRNKNLKKDGNTPTLFFGYGAYGSVAKPRFNPNFLTWVAEGGTLVFPHVRGSGQKGEKWHKAGQKTTKPNTWKDMIAVTEYLNKEGYSSPQKSAIWGSSAGGILAGRAMTERPDLYKAVILTSPATNMLRSEVQPNGQNSIKEFGTVEIKEEFEALLEMDAYHHIKKGVKYPATLVTGGMKDGRVVIWDPAKFVARLQASNAADTPTLFEVRFDTGHSGINTSEMFRYKLYANAFSFALWQMGHPDYQPE